MGMSMKSVLAFCLVVSLLVIAFMARECTHRKQEASLTRQLNAQKAEAEAKDGEIEQQARRIDALRAELDAAAQIHTAIDTARSETVGMKDRINEAISNEEESRDWYMGRIPDAVLRAFDVRMCAADEDPDADRVCRAK